MLLRENQIKLALDKIKQIDAQQYIIDEELLEDDNNSFQSVVDPFGSDNEKKQQDSIKTSLILTDENATEPITL